VSLGGPCDGQQKGTSGTRLKLALELYERRDDVRAVCLDDEWEATLWALRVSGKKRVAPFSSRAAEDLRTWTTSAR
jgi:hypothetical protein